VQEIGWFGPEEMSALTLNGFASATLRAIEVLH
jgi:hypothetical protein